MRDERRKIRKIKKDRKYITCQRMTKVSKKKISKKERQCKEKKYEERKRKTNDE